MAKRVRSVRLFSVAFLFVVAAGVVIFTWWGSRSGIGARAGTDSAITADPEQVAYGRELVTRTAYYLGPRGIVSQTTNGMNCQNCHLEAGTKSYGNNYFAVAATYPKFRARSGTVESVEKRVNDCIERSLNGKALDPGSRELTAFVAYIKSVGAGRTGEEPGTGLPRLEFLDRPADTVHGRVVFERHCTVCHTSGGTGQMAEDQRQYIYPPLWGNNSYNTGAGLFRLSRFAAFVRYNMPLGVRYDSSVLTDEEAWDVAAYVNSRNRPQRDLTGDWPDMTTKPVDHPFGPYVDTFPEQQHKYGPFKPIQQFRDLAKKQPL